MKSWRGQTDGTIQAFNDPPTGNSRQASIRLGRASWKSSQSGPPDLDEYWREFNRKLASLFGKKQSFGGGNGGGNFSPTCVTLAWVLADCGRAGADLACHRIFIVQEGQQAVITQFGKYKTTVGQASTGVGRARFNATKWYL